jgi:hypothetical protein
LDAATAFSDDRPRRLGQAKRYRKRGKQGMASGEESDFGTCMAARETYIESYLTSHSDEDTRRHF